MIPAAGKERRRDGKDRAIVIRGFEGAVRPHPTDPIEPTAVRNQRPDLSGVSGAKCLKLMQHRETTAIRLDGVGCILACSIKGGAHEQQPAGISSVVTISGIIRAKVV